MVKLLPLFAFIAIGNLFAQEDNIKYKEKYGFFEDQEILSEYDYALLTKEPTKFLLKVNAPNGHFFASFAENRIPFNLQIAYEHKLGKDFSINGGLDFSSLSEDVSSHIMNTLGISLEPRWYFKMVENIKLGKSANNLSGVYFGLELRAEEERLLTSSSTIESYGYTVLFKYGLQKRFFKNAYVDLALGTGFRHRWYVRKRIIQPSIKLGFAFGEKTNINLEDAGCVIFRCYKEEKRLLKFDLVRIFDFQNFNYQSILGFKPKVAYEFKLPNSPFSVVMHTGLDLEYYFANLEDFGAENLHEFKVGYHVGMEQRYYYNLYKRIAAGKSANNFSASYFFLKASYGYDDNLESSISNGFFGWGIQRRIFDIGYIDFQTGGIVPFKEANREEKPSLLYASLRIGIALN